MSYETFFSLGLEMDNRTVTQVCTASRTDMGTVGFTMLSFHINNHPFIQQFIVCCRQTRSLILGEDFLIHNYTVCDWTPWGTKRFTGRGKLIMEIDEPEADKFFAITKSVHIPQALCSNPNPV